MSLRKKLVITMLLISFIPLVLLSTIMIRYLSKSLEEEKISQFREIAAEVKLQIDGLLDQPITAIKVVASNPAVGAFDLAQTKSFLVQARKTYPDISIVLDDLKGNMVVRGDDAALANIKDRAYFQDIINGKDLAIANPVISKTNGQLTLNIATPVKDGKTGSLLGVVQGAITISKVSEFVKQLSTNGTTVYVVDNTGKIMAHPNEQLVKESTDVSAVSFVKEGLTGKKSGFSTVEDITVGKKLVTYKYDDRTGWLICLEVPYSATMGKVRSLSIILIVSTLAVLGIVAALVLFMSKRIIAPIYRMQAVADKISQGDLTQTIEINSKDEIGLLARSFNAMVANLKGLIGQVQDNTQHVAASSQQLTASAEQSARAANQVADSITQVAQGAETQLHVVSEASMAVDQMTASIQVVANNANTVSSQSAKASETAVQGGKSVESAVKQMVHLEQTVSTSSLVVTQLGERSKEIGQIVGTISEIASQTNLLALNAAIEAARAGEQGRGFAVVAGEVRKLAEQSQAAAEQISHLIKEIQEETDKAVSAMNAGTQGVKVGTEVVNEAGYAFQEIIGLVTQLSDQVEEISSSIQHLSEGGQRIVESVKVIDTLTRASADEAQNVSAATEEQSASMEEIAASSQQLATMSQSLQDAVSKFRM